MYMNWSQSVDSLLDKIRLNSVYLTNRHINNHLYYKNCSKYFEIPTIVLSVFSGSFSVGSDGFLNQELISIVSCSISMLITILTSIKLYMKIQENSTQEQELAVSFKTLALDIFKTLSLPEEDRGIDGLIYLNKTYGKYIYNEDIFFPSYSFFIISIIISSCNLIRFCIPAIIKIYVVLLLKLT